MNNLLSNNPNSYQLMSLSKQNNVILPGLTESPHSPVIKMPQTYPPILFLPNFSQPTF